MMATPDECRTGRFFLVGLSSTADKQAAPTTHQIVRNDMIFISDVVENHPDLSTRFVSKRYCPRRTKDTNMSEIIPEAIAKRQSGVQLGMSEPLLRLREKSMVPPKTTTEQSQIKAWAMSFWAYGESSPERGAGERKAAGRSLGSASPASGICC